MAELGVGCSPNVACEFKRADFPEGGIRAMRTLRMLLDAGDLRLATCGSGVDQVTVYSAPQFDGVVVVVCSSVASFCRFMIRSPGLIRREGRLRKQSMRTHLWCFACPEPDLIPGISTWSRQNEWRAANHKTTKPQNHNPINKKAAD